MSTAGLLLLIASTGLEVPVPAEVLTCLWFYRDRAAYVYIELTRAEGTGITDRTTDYAINSTKQSLNPEFTLADALNFVVLQTTICILSVTRNIVPAIKFITPWRADTSCARAILNWWCWCRHRPRRGY